MKENFEKFWRLTLSALCVAAMLVATPAMAEDDDDDDDEEVTVGDVVAEMTWEERKKDIDAFYAGKVAEYRASQEKVFAGQVVVEFIKAQIRRRMNTPFMGDFRILRIPGLEVDWTGFDKAPTKEKDAIVDEVREAAIEHAIDRIRPDERRQAILDSASERFRMVEINERVTLMLRNGRGAAALIENQPLRAVNDERVQLGNRYIIREDLDEEDQAKFYPDVNKRLKEAYVVNSIGKIDAELESMVAQECYDKTASGFLENNYVPDILKPNANLRTAKPEYWIAKKDFVERVRRQVIDKRVELYEKTEMPKIMEGAGYFYVKTTDGRGMEWVDLQEKTLREMPQPDPNQMNNNGMGPGMMGPPPMGPMPGGY